MKPPRPHLHERQRLQALRALDLLDTQPEERFQRYTRVAAAICEAPIAIMSLVDQDRQWFKSGCGVEGITQLPREISFCGHAILEKGVFYIPDTRLDPRFAANPLVVGEPFIRFYAGCPVFLPGDMPVGTLCVLDHRPRELSTDQIARLRDLADCLQRELHLHLLLQDIGRLAGSTALQSLQPVNHK